MTVGPSNIRSLKAALFYLRTGTVRWFETVNSNFQSIVALFSVHLRRCTHVSGASGAYHGRMVCRDPAASGTALDNVRNADPATANIKYPLQALYESSTGGSDDTWHAKTMGTITLSGGHAVTPGTLGYLATGGTGLVTTSSASGVIVGVYLISPYFLFLPHN
jgi:hypothetical protein